MKNVIMLLIIFGISMNVLSEEIANPAVTYSLEKCIETALSNNPQMKIAEQKVISARGKKTEAFSGYLPQISASAVYTKLSEPTFKIDPSMAALFGDMLDPSMTSDVLYTGKLSLFQPIFMWGKVYQFNKQAKMNYQMSIEEARKIKNETVLATKQAFYGYLLAQNMAQISSEAYSVTEEHYSVAKAYYDDGRISSYDVSQAKIAMLNAKSNLVRAENGLALAYAALINILNLPENEAATIKFEGELKIISMNNNLPELKKEALQNRPEIKQLELTENISKSLVLVSKTGNKPSIIATGDYTMQYGGQWDPDFDKWTKKWDAIVALQIPIFDGFATSGRIKQSKANLEQVKQSKEQASKGIELEVEQVYLTLQQNKNIIDAQKETMDTALQNLQTAKTRYAEGLMSSIEIRDAQLSATIAEINYYQSLTEYLIATAKLEKAVGK